MAAITWTGAAGDGNFNNPANWSPAQVPGATDTVTISPSAASLINIGTADAVQALKMSATVTLSVNDGASLTVGNASTKNASLSNAGTIELNNFNYSTGLIIGGPEVTLSGSGTILMGTGTNNLIYGASSSDILNNTGNLIEGAGNIGDGTLTYINGAGSTVNANDGNYLYLNTGANVVTNAALLEATAGGGLVIQSSVANGTAGKISAIGANVYLQSGADISGGTLSSKASFAIADSNSATLDGSTNALTNLGTVAIQDNTTLSLLGSIVNSGQIVLEHFNYNTDLVIGPTGTKAGTVTLSGSGTILLGDNGGNGNRIYGAIAGDTLINMGNTIAGAGQLGAGTLSLINDGTINASGGNALYLSTGATAVNNKLIEATSTGGLIIQSAVNSSGGGTILAANGNVVLNGGTLAGGLVSTTGAGVVFVSGSGTLDGSAQTVTNTGLISVDDNSGLYLLGTITNTGTISLNAFDYNSNLLADSATVSLTGGGAILLNSDGANLITAATAGNGLVNVNNTIEGAAQLGDGTLTFTNDAAGIVNANTGGQLVLNTGTIATTNMGLLEASAGSGGLVIQTNVNNGTTGRISAAGGNVFLASGADIIGGTLSSSGTGTVVDSNTATLGVVGGTITNAGTVTVQDGSTLSLLGTILNDKLISLNQFDYNTDLIIGSTTAVGTTTLSGSGTVSLDQYSGNRIYAGFAGDTLVNLNNTITGGGQIGVGAGANTLLLTNDGTISASGGGSLVINTGAVVTNNALIESTGASNLYIDGVINSSSGGTILAASGNVLLNGGTLQGGLANSNAGFAIVDINSATLDGSKQTVTQKGIVTINDGATLTLLGTITNDGTITLNSNDYNTDLIVGGPTVTLTGGGTILFDQNTANRIYGAVGTDVLVNVNNTIEGAGQIGASQMILVNDAKGIIDANQTSGLYLTSASGGTITNAGLLESTSTGGLWVQTTINDSTGGTILAKGGDVILNTGSLVGGLMAGSAGGFFDVNASFTLDGSGQTVTNDTLVSINDGSTLTLLGTLTNAGTITLNNNDYYTDLVVGAPTVTLTGSGTILLGNGGSNRIYGTAGSDKLINVNNLIEGGGQIGAGQLTLNNEAAGIIDANDAVGLTLNTGSTVINSGLIEATGAGGLAIEAVVDSSSGGTILAAGSDVYLGGATLQGGLIKSTGSGAFIVNGPATLDGSAHTLTSSALISVDDGTILTLLGNIANSGTITVNPNDYYTDVIIGSPTVTLTGAGTIQLNGGGARLYGAAVANVLDNVSNLIEGTGQLGGGQLTLINAGVIDANVSGGTLAVNLGTTGMNSATGSMLATGSGILAFQNGTYTNLGLYEATDGSALTFQSGAALTNDSASGTLTGGTYTAIDGGHGATISITGSAVNTLDAAIVLSGANSAVLFGGTAIDTSLATIGTTGALSVLGGRNFTVTANGGTFADNGTITLGGGTFADTKMIIGAHAELAGFGIVDGPISNSGTIEAVGGKLILAGGISGTGTITTGAGGIIDFASGGTITQPISGNGTLELGGGTFTIADNNITIANLDVDAKTSLTGTGTVTSQTVDTGTITANGGTLSLTGAVSGTGTLAASASSVLVVGAGTSFGGDIAGAGTVDLAGATTLLAGIQLQAASIMQSSTVTLAAGVSVTNLAGNTYTLTAAAPGNLTPHRAQVQIQGGQGDVFTNAGSLVANTSAVIAVAFTNSGKLADTKGTLTVSGALAGAGSIAISRPALVDLTGGATYAGAFTGVGTLALDSAVTLNTGASLGVTNIIDTNLLTLGSGESIKIGGGNIFALADAGGDDLHRAQVQVTGGSGSTFTNAGTVTASALADSFNLKFVNNGLTLATAGTLSFLGVVTNSGTFDASGGVISMSKAVSGTGTLEISAASTFSLLSTVAAGQTADFLSTSGALDLGDALKFAGTIAGFGGSDVIDLLKTASTSETFAAGVLTVQDNGATVASLHFAGSYTTADFMLSSDGNSGTNIVFV